MAFCAPPQLIPEDPPLFQPEEPGFESLVGSNMPDPDDVLAGLDVILGGPLGAIDDDVAALSTLDVLLAAATFAPGAWAAANIAPLIALYASLGAAGDVLLAGLLAAIANLPVVPPPPDIPPDPQVTLEELCAACAPELQQVTIINISDVGPSTPPGSPIPPLSGDCLNPAPGGGYVAGPCPTQGNPPDNPPDQGGGDQGGGDQGGDNQGDGGGDQGGGYGGGGGGGDGGDYGGGDFGGEIDA